MLSTINDLSAFYQFFLLFRVVTLSMSPLDDSFISGSLDKTLRLWDLRSHNCQVWLHCAFAMLIRNSYFRHMFVYHFLHVHT